MRVFSPLASGVVLIALAASAPGCRAQPANDPLLARKNFEQAVARVANLQLPLNRAHLYQQAAAAVAQMDKAEAVALLERALSEIDAAEVVLRAEAAPDNHAQRALVMERQSAILELMRVDSAETLRLLAPPQAADGDIELQRQVLDRIAGSSVDQVRDFVTRKLDFGVTPAVEAGYEVLQRRDPAAAKWFAVAMVYRLKGIDPAENPLAIQSAFTLAKLLKSEGGRREVKVSLSAPTVDADSLKTLYAFLGDAFVEALDPRVLVLTEKPSSYMQLMKQYAPEKAEEVTAAVAAAAAAQSAKSTADPTAKDTEAPTADEQKQLEAARVQVQALLTAQIRETSARMKVLSARAGLKTLPEQERDEAVFSVVEEANRAISLGRVLDKDLQPQTFGGGELEFYGRGLLSGVVESASSILQRYAGERPSIAEDAASRLDGPEVQTEVELQIAIREMNGNTGSFGGRDGRRHRMGDELERASP